MCSQEFGAVLRMYFGALITSGLSLSVALGFGLPFGELLRCFCLSHEDPFVVAIVVAIVIGWTGI